MISHATLTQSKSRIVSNQSLQLSFSDAVASHCPWGEWLVDDGNTPPGMKLSRKASRLRTLRPLGASQCIPQTLHRRHILFGTLTPWFLRDQRASRLHKKPPSEAAERPHHESSLPQPTRQCWRSVASRPSWPAVTSRL
ncbi:hypothetical protein J3F84DRAFT_371620 [Trichoderma pleuroticola]